MRRAIETATPTARTCGLELQMERELHERLVGGLVGTPTRGHDDVWPDTLRRWLAGETSLAMPGAESFDDIHRRSLPGLAARHHRPCGKKSLSSRPTASFVA
jgi:broad specificity phosphatase PhoE